MGRGEVFGVDDSKKARTILSIEQLYLVKLQEEKSEGWGIKDSNV